MVAEACRISYRRAITSSNLIEDFGHQSSRGTALMRSLADAFKDVTGNSLSDKIYMLFEEWRTLYGQVADLSPEQLRDINGTLRFAEATSISDVPERLFVVHTFNSLVTKLLAAEVVTAHGLSSGRTFAGDLATLEDDTELLDRLETDVENGGFFEATGIHGFVEEAIFSWYLDAASASSHKTAICNAIRQVLAELALYRTDKLDNSRDVLRDFYQDLVPELLRKTLGEFYTPDWLVEFTANQAGVVDWSEVRVLDPTCGSGSFLVEVIRRKRAAARDRHMTSQDSLRMIIDSVWGFDLNPLAVQIARTNYLLAIADLLEAKPGEQIEIPVLLADAVYSPAQLPDAGDNLVDYTIGSQIANLNIVLPGDLAADRETLDQAFEVMAEHVEANADYRNCETALGTRLVLEPQQLELWADPLETTYNQVLGLHRQRWNGIWFRIVRNFFWSATAGTFDLIIGNPPWVRWSKLPEAYRERAKPTCEQYDIFSDTPHHGGNELDISAMITYTTADKWLKHEGTLAFVITQTHFQSPSSQGFRRFRIDNENYLRPIIVDDLSNLKPFPEAANKTSIVVWQKTDVRPEYPVRYRRWTAKKGHSRSINTDCDLREVFEQVALTELEASPVDADGSPWAILAP